MSEKNDTASKLIGYQFATGWKITKFLGNTKSGTGGVYSLCFEVERDGLVSFLKTYDLNAYLRKYTSESFADVTQRMLQQFIYERDLSDICKKGHSSNIVCVKEHGEEFVSQINMVVPYLIFDMADGDVRAALDFTDRLDFAWKMKSLHDVAVGLSQLHNLGITHQDVKPSNILVFGKDSKVGDLGCSTCESLNSPFKNDLFPGDNNYAPPEKSYKVNIPNKEEQNYLTDSYLLGSLIVFYLVGQSMNALLYRYLPQTYHPSVYDGRFEEVESYLLDAYTKAIDEISEAIPYNTIKDRVINIVKSLCHPLTKERVLPRNRKSSTIKGKYNLEGIISELDYIRRVSEINVFKNKNEYR